MTNANTSNVDAELDDSGRRTMYYGHVDPRERMPCEDGKEVSSRGRSSVDPGRARFAGAKVKATRSQVDEASGRARKVNESRQRDREFVLTGLTRVAGSRPSSVACIRRPARARLLAFVLISGYNRCWSPLNRFGRFERR